MGLFKRSAAARAKKIGAHARYVNEDVQRVDLKVTSTDGETVTTIDLSLDQTRQLASDLTNAYGACRPALLDQKQVDRITRSCSGSRTLPLRAATRRCSATPGSAGRRRSVRDRPRTPPGKPSSRREAPVRCSAHGQRSWTEP